MRVSLISDQTYSEGSSLGAQGSFNTAKLTSHKLESRLPGETSMTSDMQMTPPLWQKVKKT